MPAGLDACAALLREQPRVRHCRGPNRKSLEAARLFLRFLREQGALPPPAVAPSLVERWPLLGEFRAWARQHRGLAETSIDAYQRILAELLAVVGDDPRAYTAEELRGFVLERARRHRIARAKTVVVATRAFLRFLGATGRCSPGMEHAIPGFASWQLSSVPRFLAVEDVERVIASCPTDGNGPRDRAVLLLLARLGLRASEAAGAEVRGHRLAQWSSRRLRQGTPPGVAAAAAGGRRRDPRLPAPRQAALAGTGGVHIDPGAGTPADPRRGDPHRACRTAPGRRRGTDQRRTRPAPFRRNRHASAGRVPGGHRRGAAPPLAARTTAHYAKVDFGLLSEVAQPWPGAVS